MPAARRRIGLPVRLLVAQLVVFAVGIAALVEKRTVRRHRREQRSTNAAA